MCILIVPNYLKTSHPNPITEQNYLVLTLKEITLYITFKNYFIKNNFVDVSTHVSRS